ncbi:hypothetical protein J4N45_23390 [Vibrio sp. SCSIO 43140]|uniref:hypothetical protein n=1 Tax=Vibrio sp. SCSIO 43140 TaxID=2819100 RepID=UPI002075472C|nr:hypothetical protein [Vibrio sp. SCSIO 43140]USD62321.1 hypothetical protein J4N45_23390 [Vibrio sp. SCSIO 43140]
MKKLITLLAMAVSFSAAAENVHLRDIQGDVFKQSAKVIEEKGSVSVDYMFKCSTPVNPIGQKGTYATKVEIELTAKNGVISAYTPDLKDLEVRHCQSKMKPVGTHNLFAAIIDMGK